MLRFAALVPWLCASVCQLRPVVARPIEATSMLDESMFRCPREGGPLFPDPFSCTHFIVCEYVGTIWERAQRMACPPRLYFRRDIDICDYGSNVDCNPPSGAAAAASNDVRTTTTPSLFAFLFTQDNNNNNNSGSSSSSSGGGGGGDWTTKTASAEYTTVAGTGSTVPRTTDTDLQLASNTTAPQVTATTNNYSTSTATLGGTQTAVPHLTGSNITARPPGDVTTEAGRVTVFSMEMTTVGVVDRNVTTPQSVGLSSSGSFTGGHVTESSFETENVTRNEVSTTGSHVPAETTTSRIDGSSQTSAGSHSTGSSQSAESNNTTGSSHNTGNNTTEEKSTTTVHGGAVRPGNFTLSESVTTGSSATTVGEGAITPISRRELTTGSSNVSTESSSLVTSSVSGSSAGIMSTSLP